MPLPFKRFYPDKEPAFKLVYRSGHTNTYCDGTMHVNTNGGWVWPTPERFWERRPRYRCDCAYWNEQAKKELESRKMGD